MPKGYVIVRANVTNATQYAQYAVKSGEAIKQYGGTILVRGGRCQVTEGQGWARNVVVEFPNFDQAQAYATSPEYAAAKTLREGAGVLDIVVVEGA